MGPGVVAVRINASTTAIYRVDEFTVVGFEREDVATLQGSSVSVGNVEAFPRSGSGTCGIHRLTATAFGAEPAPRDRLKAASDAIRRTGNSNCIPHRAHGRGSRGAVHV